MALGDTNERVDWLNAARDGSELRQNILHFEVNDACFHSHDRDGRVIIHKITFTHLQRLTHTTYANQGQQAIFISMSCFAN